MAQLPSYQVIWETVVSSQFVTRKQIALRCGVSKSPQLIAKIEQMVDNGEIEKMLVRTSRHTPVWIYFDRTERNGIEQAFSSDLRIR